MLFLNNPDARHFLTAMVEDWAKSNELDGLMWESEQQGPLNETIGAYFGKFNGTSFINCFCTHCVQKATEQGINVARAREGYLALEQWVKRTYGQPGAMTARLSHTGDCCWNIPKYWLGKSFGSRARRKLTA